MLRGGALALNEVAALSHALQSEFSLFRPFFSPVNSETSFRHGSFFGRLGLKRNFRPANSRNSNRECASAE